MPAPPAAPPVTVVLASGHVAAPTRRHAATPAAPEAARRRRGRAAPASRPRARFKGASSLAPEFAELDGKHTLFVILRSADRGGMPLAPQKFEKATVPAGLRLRRRSPSRSTSTTRPEILQGELKVYARLVARRPDPIGAAGDIESRARRSTQSAARADPIAARPSAKEKAAVNAALAAAHRAALMRAPCRAASAVVCTGREIIRNRDTHFRFRPDSDFWYLTGFAEPDAVRRAAPRRRDRSAS